MMCNLKLYVPRQSIISVHFNFQDHVTDPLAITHTNQKAPPLREDADKRISRLSVDIPSPSIAGEKRRNSESSDLGGLASPTKRMALNIT